ncbi:MAG: hypothetical protein LKJ31_02735 [Atopobiaceae bacterium]|nr:hypothetical protein [Atopobiaceae bacterium]
MSSLNASHGLYNAAKGVIQYYFLDLADLRLSLEDHRFLDWCYRLNVEMLRRCKNPQGHFSNPLLVRAVN